MDNSLYNIYQTFPSIFGNSGYPIPQNSNYIDPIQESKGLIGTDSIQGKIPKFSELGELDLNKSQINPVSEASRALRESRMS